jgi:hypothetical protein
VALCREDALVRVPGRHSGGVRVAAVSAAANAPLVSQRSSSSLGAHFGSSFVGALNEPSRVLPQLFCEIVRHIAHLRSEAEFFPTQVAVWQLFPAPPLRSPPLHSIALRSSGGELRGAPLSVNPHG